MRRSDSVPLRAVRRCRWRWGFVLRSIGRCAESVGRVLRSAQLKPKANAIALQRQPHVAHSASAELRGKAKPRLKPSANAADEARELAELEQRAPWSTLEHTMGAARAPWRPMHSEPLCTNSTSEYLNSPTRKRCEIAARNPSCASRSLRASVGLVFSVCLFSPLVASQTAAPIGSFLGTVAPVAASLRQTVGHSQCLTGARHRLKL
jgi:hypothetical protein